MKARLLILASIVISLIFAETAITYAWQQHQRRVRDANYQSILLSYSASLKPGITREQVEAYIQARGARFERVCCTAGQGFEDLEQIGKEDAPWYCGKNNVYLEFRFEAAEYSESDVDPLRTISIIHKLGECL